MPLLLSQLLLFPWLSTGWKKGELIEREVSSGNNRAGKKIN
jgi:hypothetical protein